MNKHINLVLQLAILGSFKFAMGMQPHKHEMQIPEASDQQTAQPSAKKRRPAYPGAVHGFEPLIFQFMESSEFNFEELNRIVTEEEPGVLLQHNKDGLTPLHLLVKKGDYQTIKRIFALTFEYFRKDTKFIKEVLNAKAEGDGYTPLHLAVNLACHNSIDSVFYEIFKKLLDQPLTYVNALTNQGQTALDIALTIQVNHTSRSTVYSSIIPQTTTSICRNLIAMHGISTVGQKQCLEGQLYARLIAFHRL